MWGRKPVCTRVMWHAKEAGKERDGEQGQKEPERGKEKKKMKR